MTDTPLHHLTAVELKQRLADGTLTSVAITQALLARIERLEPTLNAFVHVCHERALAAAARSDARRDSGQPASAFDGVPVVLKDIIEVEGLPTSGGSRTRDGQVSTHTATLARRLEAAGLVTLGKTHTVEFAMGGWGTNKSMGTPRNPWDLETHRAPGGSSSGTGVAVAAGYAPWGLGTDTGGSVRLPAAWNGLVGLKTTLGRISCDGVMPLARSLDTPGPLARSVTDAAHLYALMAGPDRLDPATLAHRLDDPFPAMSMGIEDVVIARMPRAERFRASREVLASHDATAKRLKALGAKLVDVELPLRFEETGTLAGRVIAAEGYAEHGHLLETRADALDPDIIPRLAPGASMSATDYYRALREHDAAIAAFEAAIEGIDAVLLPTAPTPAPVVEFIDQTDTPAWFTRPANAARMCALCLPCGLTEPTGDAPALPLSQQIMCRGYEEATALRIGAALAADLDFTDHPPGLARLPQLALRRRQFRPVFQPATPLSR